MKIFLLEFGYFIGGMLLVILLPLLIIACLPSIIFVMFAKWAKGKGNWENDINISFSIIEILIFTIVFWGFMYLL